MINLLKFLLKNIGPKVCNFVDIYLWSSDDTSLLQKIK